MSAPGAMNCERASQLITELVCGELDADVAASVRAHAEKCATCGPELSRFARVLAVAQELPLEAPSPAVDQRIMLAAREAISRRAGGAVSIDASGPAGGIKAWLERLGTWAMSPQVAMASVLLLVVGIGLYALPFGEDGAGPAALQLAQEPEAATPQPAASATAAPTSQATADDEAVALEAPAPPPSPEESAALEGASPAEEPAPRAFPADAPDEARALRRARGEAAPEAKVGAYGKKGDALDDLEGLGGVTSGAGSGSMGPIAAQKQAPGGRAASNVDSAPAAELADRMALEESARETERASSVAAKPAARAPAPAPVAESAEYDYAPVPAAPAAASPEPAKSAESSKAEVSYADLLADGIKAAQTGDHARAVALLERVVASGPLSMRSSARTWLARSLRALDRCESALVHYAPLVDAPSPPLALINEAADCYARVGRTADAEALRMRAKSAGSKAAPVKAAPAPKQ